MKSKLDAYNNACLELAAARQSLEEAEVLVEKAKHDLLLKWLSSRCYRVGKHDCIEFLPVVSDRRVWSVSSGYAIGEADAAASRLPYVDDVLSFFTIRCDRCVDVSQEDGE